jgi:hypothetical protein
MAVHQCPKIKTPSGDRAFDEAHTGALKPALASIPDACKYMGGVSRAKFYIDVLPLLETIHVGTRHFVVVASIDRLIEKLKDAPATGGADATRHPPRTNPTVAGTCVRS